tara:strand:- start:43 stop:207 length:165 start_codon:yes stop_codon:yes gene_type:complete
VREKERKRMREKERERKERERERERERGGREGGRARKDIYTYIYVCIYGHIDTE